MRFVEAAQLSEDGKYFWSRRSLSLKEFDLWQIKSRTTHRATASTRISMTNTRDRSILYKISRNLLKLASVANLKDTRVDRIKVSSQRTLNSWRRRQVSRIYMSGSKKWIMNWRVKKTVEWLASCKKLSHQDSPIGSKKLAKDRF
jgi:hypothetical protein